MEYMIFALDSDTTIDEVNRSAEQGWRLVMALSDRSMLLERERRFSAILEEPGGVRVANDLWVRSDAPLCRVGGQHG